MHYTEKDPEKPVLPTILFLNMQHPDFKEHGAKGFGIYLGWWNACVSISIGRIL
jgi:hypothetical protein